MRLGKLFCLFNRHDPNRRKVYQEGFEFVGQCRNCGRKIHRVGHKQWRLMADSPAGPDNQAG